MSLRFARGWALTLGCIVIGAVCVAGMPRIVAQLGPLDPPAGPIRDTSPSLAELQQSIEALRAEIQAVSSSFVDRDIRVHYVPPGTPAQIQSTMIGPPGSRVVAIAGYNSSAAIFDGPGELVAGGSLLVPSPVNRVLARLNGVTVQAGPGPGVYTVNTFGYPIGAIAPDGIYLSQSLGTNGYVLVYYEVPS